MTERRMTSLELDIPFDAFQRLPRHPAYKYEYFSNRAWINPRPRYYHARLDLSSYSPPDPAKARIRPLIEDDWQHLPPVFSSAFLRQEPFAGGTPEERLEAAREALEQTRAGKDGPLIPPACLIVEDDQGHRLGAVLVTLVPGGDPEAWDAFLWETPPPEGCVERREGVPHLTWAFVAQMVAGNGLGTALLARAVDELKGMGFDELFSTFLAGNESSALWHWRQGFDLLSYPGSFRRWKKRGG